MIRVTTVESTDLNGGYEFASVNKASSGESSEENTSSLFPGRAANTAKEFSWVAAMWALRKTSNWERKNDKDKGY
jgi:hypothetical protein